VGIQADGPTTSKPPPELKSMSIQTKKKRTNDTYIQSEKVDQRSMTTQTHKEKNTIKQRDMDIQTEV
jgi:hypothetical protein